MRNLRALSLPALAALAPLLAGCGAASRSPDTVAVVCGSKVTYAELAAYVEAETDSPAAALESPVLSRLLDQHLTERLLVRVARDRGLVAPDAGTREALSALLRSAPAGQPVHSEALARYRDRRAELTLPERVRLRQVLTQTREEADAARAELAAGADFADVARRYSEDPSAPYGGAQGELGREDLPEEFADVIFGLAPGEVSEVLEADYGFHVFQVTARLPGRVVPFDEAEKVLTQEVREERVRAWLDGLVEEARSRYAVRVYEENLPFDYRGAYSSAGP
ncbi:MAG TPA: peptidyl-prolyl cis-trans isomerase [Thermoanaerobaculia bacterium]|nr:peptidyl-prolyl cis-trans isomerase [Thermoanaerobaculia bacterium]